MSSPRGARSAFVAVVATGALSLPGLAFAHDGGESGGDVASNVRSAQVQTQGQSKGMEFVANLQYDKTGGNQEGSDIEFMRKGKRKFALAGTLRKGLHIIDITRPAKPRRVAVYDCKISQGDVQVWKRGKRILASYTADGSVGEIGAESTCAKDLGLSADDAGTVILDITKPHRPRSLSFLPVELGSHNMTIHPNGKYLYNSNSDLLTSTSPSIAIYNIANPRRPRLVQEFKIPFVPTSLGSESHDITFSPNGKRAYSAALSQTLVLDTTRPGKPSIISQIVDPTINLVHQADPITMRSADGRLRRMLVITDERAGAAASVECPGGGLHVYDITGSREKDPVKMGTWFIPVVTPQDGSVCTSHVLRMYPQQKMMTIAWYSQGVRVLDLSGMADAAANPVGQSFGEGIGMKEVGFYTFSDSDNWSFKTNQIRSNGSFYGYGNDLVRGFDVYRFDGRGIGKVPPLQPQDLKPKQKRQTNP